MSTSLVILPAAVTAIGLSYVLAGLTKPRTKKVNGKKHKLPPGSKIGIQFPIPFIGETLDYGRSQFLFAKRHVEKYGNVVYSNVLFRNTVILSGPEGMKAFYDPELVSREHAFPWFIQNLLAGPIQPMSDDPDHAIRRNAVSQAFKTREAIEFHLKKLDPVLKEYLDRMSHMKDFDFSVEGLKLCADLASTALFSDPSLGEQYVQDSRKVFIGITSLPIKLPFTGYGRGMKARDRMIEMYRQKVKEHLAHPEKYDDGLTTIINELKKSGVNITIEKINAPGITRLITDLHHLFLAFVAVGYAYTNMLIAIKKWPQSSRKMIDELRTLNIKAEEEISLEKLKKLEHTGHFINEVRRYFPFLAGMFGKTKKGFELNGYYIPKDWIVVGSFYTTNHSKDYKDADEFNPDRSLSEPVSGPLYGFVPQGGGPDTYRRCPGEDLVFYLMELFLVRLYSTNSNNQPNFTWEITTEKFPLRWSLFHPEPLFGLKIANFRKAQ